MAQSEEDVVSPSQDFRTVIIAMLVFSDWLPRYGTIVRPEFFVTTDEKAAVEWINWYYDKYQAIPYDEDLENGLGDNPLLPVLRGVPDQDITYAEDVVLEFAKTQAMKLAIIASVDDIKDGNLGHVRGRVEEALAIGQDRLDLGWELVDDAEDWVYDELHGKRFPTGWPAIDRILGGGLVAGEYGLIMAPPGQGKTTALINIGFSMTGLMGLANVLHITLEMPKQKVLKRYASRLTGSRLVRGHNEKQYIAAMRDKANMMARLRVADPARTMDAMRRLIDDLFTVADFHTEALIVDYADLMNPLVSRRERRFEISEVTRALRELGSEYNMPVWSATQSGRDSLHKEVITMFDIAEAIEKAAIADVIIAICQTRDEVELNQGRLFLAKVRDAKGGVSIPVRIDRAAQSIIQRRGVSV